MRYNSATESQYLRRRALGPVAATAQRRYALPVPGRGLQGLSQGVGHRIALRGFGATSIAPIGAGSGAGAAIGAQQGASIGSAIVPGIGTAVGALVGAVGGAIAGAINKTDPENVDFDAAVALWQQNPNAVYSIGNPYLALAGLFDLNITTNIPIYRKFGHMGEAAFVVWLCNTVYQAAQQGRITSSDTALTIMANVVQPAIDAWGYGPMSDPHADLIQRLIVTLILQYCAGAQGNWYAVGGDYPSQFRSIPPFALPGAAPVVSPSASVPAPTSSATPSPVPTSPDGTYITGPGTSVVTPAGTWTLGSPPDAYGNLLVLLNGQATSAHGQVVLWSGGTLYVGNSAGWFYYTGNPGNLPNTAEPAAAVAHGMPAQFPVLTATPTAPTSSPTPTTVSTTPPAVGAALTTAMDSINGQMLIVPAGATYGGLSATGAWLVVYATGANAGTYTLQNGTLVPVATGTATVTTPVTTTPTTTPIPAGYTITAQSVLLNGTSYPLYVDASGNQYVWTGNTMVPYTTAATTSAAAPLYTGGGGGGYYASPNTPIASTTPVATPVATASDSSPWLLLGGAALGLYLLMGRS